MRDEGGFELGRNEVDFPLGGVEQMAIPRDRLRELYRPRRHTKKPKKPKVLRDKPIDRVVKGLAYLVALGAIAFAAYYGYGSYEARQTSNPVKRVSPQLEQYVRDHPRDLRGRLNLADAYLNLGYSDEAIEQYNQALKLNKKEQSALVGIGLAYMKKEDEDKALEYFEKAIELGRRSQYAGINSVLEMAYFQAGSIWLKKSHYDKALDYFKQSAAIRPGSSDTYLAIGRALLEKKDYQHASIEFERALTFDPNYVDAHYGLGLALEKLGRKDEALVHFRRALELNPEFKLAREAIDRLEKKH